MKKILSVILCAVMVLSMAATVLAVDSAKNMGTVAGTSETMTLDGKKDAAYSKGLKLDGSTTADGKASALGSFKMDTSAWTDAIAQMTAIKDEYFSDFATGTRSQQFLLKDAAGNTVYGYLNT